MNQKEDSLRKASFILAIITCVLVGWTIIPLAWAIPMTIMIKRSITSGKNHIALGICSLLFLNVIIGILMLISNDK